MARRCWSGWGCEMYRLLFHPDVEKQLARIPGKYAKRIAESIRSLKEIPRPASARHLDQEMYRLREGDYRIIYAVFDDESVVYIGKVARRSERTYRDIARLLERAKEALSGSE